MKRKLIGNQSEFAIEYGFYDDTRETELSMFVEGKNILEFKHDNETLTTCGTLEELAMWLRDFIDNLKEDPFPVNVEGKYLAEKYDNAMDFDIANEDEYWKYHFKINDWCWSHSWHHASEGAILADVFFQLVGDKVEISWDNRGLDEGYDFTYLKGGAYIDKEVFVDVVHKFLNEYADHWY